MDEEEMEKVHLWDMEYDWYMEKVYPGLVHITNFEPHEKELYEKAIKESGRIDLEIHPGYTQVGDGRQSRIIKSDYLLGLFSTRKKDLDLTLFWATFDRLHRKNKETKHRGE